MVELLPLSIGLGLVLGLLLKEQVGLGTSGLVAPGYLALHLHHPCKVLIVLGAAFAAYGAAALWSRWSILYGQRKTSATLLAGYLVALVLHRLLPDGAEADAAMFGGWDVSLMGFILPGLMGVGMERHGIFPSLGGVVLTATLVRLTLIVLLGGEMPS